MRQGRTLQELAAALADIRDNQKDYAIRPEGMDRINAVVVDALSPDSAAVSVEEVAAATEAYNRSGQLGSVSISMRNGGEHRFVPTSHAHGQIAEYADIPREYYRRILAENPALAANAINHGFERARGDRPQGKMLRTYRGVLRALLSDRYRPLDCFDLAEVALPHLLDGKFTMESQELTDRRMYLKAVSPKREGEVVVGSVIQYGLVVSNSDVGAGMLRVEPFLKILACKNGMIRTNTFKRTHLGKSTLGDMDVSEVKYEDDTKQKMDEALFAQVRDTLNQYTTEEFFRSELEKLQDAAKIKIRNHDLPLIVERTAERVGLKDLSKNVKQSILDNLFSGAHGAGMNKWGLANAFTFPANDAALMGYDAATDLERAGGKILDLDANAWEAINAK